MGSGFSEYASEALSMRRQNEEACFPMQVVEEYTLPAHSFLFTSLRDSCGEQLLEARAFGLPVVTLYHQGAAILVQEGAGIKVHVGDPRETVEQLAAAVLKLADDADLARTMGSGACAVAQGQTWDRKAKAMLEHYSEVIGRSQVL